MEKAELIKQVNSAVIAEIASYMWASNLKDIDTLPTESVMRILREKDFIFPKKDVEEHYGGQIGFDIYDCEENLKTFIEQHADEISSEFQVCAERKQVSYVNKDTIINKLTIAFILMFMSLNFSSCVFLDGIKSDTLVGIGLLVFAVLVAEFWAMMVGHGGTYEKRNNIYSSKGDVIGSVGTGEYETCDGNEVAGRVQHSLIFIYSFAIFWTIVVTGDIKKYIGPAVIGAGIVVVLAFVWHFAIEVFNLHGPITRILASYPMKIISRIWLAILLVSCLLA